MNYQEFYRPCATGHVLQLAARLHQNLEVGFRRGAVLFLAQCNFLFGQLDGPLEIIGKQVRLDAHIFDCAAGTAFFEVALCPQSGLWIVLGSVLHHRHVLQHGNNVRLRCPFTGCVQAQHLLH